jgi:5,10-methylenetetrahydromethanopterin reductase
MATLGNELGFDLVGIADTPRNAMDPWVVMTLAALRTRRVRVPICVTNIVTRHPAVTATAAASVDLVAERRAILGVGTGHSGVVNVGAKPAPPEKLGEAVAFMRRLLRGERAAWGGAAAEIPWLRYRVPVYVAASGPRALRMAGATTDGAFVNYGLGKDHVAQVEGALRDGARVAGREPEELETWYIACLDCAERREAASEKLGNILGFVAAYVVGPDPVGRGVPPALVPAVRELRRIYTTHQSQMDAALVRRLGLFDYLRARLAVAVTPDDCVEQVRAAAVAGVQRLMFTVSLAADPVRAVELFGRHMLPAVKSFAATTARPIP